MNKIKNFLIFLLVKVSKLFKMHSFERQDSNAPRILIVSTTGLGDTLWATPAIKAIKTTYPKAFVAVLTSSIGKTLLLENPYIDKLFTIKHRCLFQLPSLLKSLRKERFDTCLIFHLSQRPTLPLCYFAKPSTLIGTAGINKGLDSLLTIALEKKYQHEIQRRLDIVAQIGAFNTTPLIEMYINEKEKNLARNFISSLPKQSPIIALHPGSKDCFKQWPPSAFIALGKKLHIELNAQILITGNLEEKPLAQTLANEIPNAINTAGLFSVRELTALLTHIDIFITNDTGPMHLAFSSNTKTIALFGPTDPHLCGPFEAKRATVLYQHKTCTPCLGKRCREAFCMLQHSPKSVFQNVLTLLNLEKVSC